MTSNLSRKQFGNGHYGDHHFGRKDPDILAGYNEQKMINELDEQDADYDLQQQVSRGHMTQAWRLG